MSIGTIVGAVRWSLLCRRLGYLVCAAFCESGRGGVLGHHVTLCVNLKKRVKPGRGTPLHRQHRGRGACFLYCTVWALIGLAVGVFTRVLPFRLPLPLMRIAIGALLLWPTFGFAPVISTGTLHGAGLFRRCCLRMAGRRADR